MSLPHSLPLPVRRLLLWGVIGVLCLFLIELGPKAYRTVKKTRFEAMAREALARGDAGTAQQWALMALRLGENDPVTNRLFADALEVGSHPMAVTWRARVVQLQDPPPAADCLAWAKAAYRVNRLGDVERALLRIVPEQRGMEGLSLEAGLALRRGQKSRADALFEQATRIEPGRAIHEINLATLRLEADDPALAAEAAERLHWFVEDPQWGVFALRALALDARRKGDDSGQLAYLQRVAANHQAVWRDRMALLDLVKRMGKPEWREHLDRLKKEASADTVQTADLAAWMTHQDMAGECLAWLEGLPESMRSHFPVHLARCDALYALKDYPGLESYLKDENWGSLDPLRMAWRARAAAEDPGGADRQREMWKKASELALDQPGLGLVLAGWIHAWGWDREAAQLMEQSADRYPSDRAQALQWLFESAHARRDALGMLKWVSRQLKFDSDNPALRNNQAYLSMLLHVQRAAGIQLAGELRRAHPQVPSVADTYALACYFEGKTQAGLEALAGLPEDLRVGSSAALKWALLLRQAGQPQKASEYQRRAEEGDLLEEEKELLLKPKWP